MATYRKRGDSWRAEVVRDGVRKSSTFKTKAEAVAWATETEADIIRGAHTELPSHTLKDALLHYGETVSPTKKGCRWELVRIDSFIGGMPFINKKLSDIKPVHIADWRDHRLTTVKGSTVNRELGLLSAVFTFAVKEWRWCSNNPVQQIIKPKNEPPRDRLIKDFEIDAIVAVLGYERWSVPSTLSHQLAICFLFAIETAMRRGEILSLEWRNVYLKQRYVHLPDTKNGHARDVPLSKTALFLLELMQKKTGDRMNVFELKNPTADTLFRKAKKRTGLTDLNFHDTRHEATTRLSKKLSMLELARMTGHKDPRNLMIYYNETAEELANKLD